MNALRVTCFLAVLALSYAQMSREQLRSAISKINPVFAHGRDSPMPVSQNTNIFLPLDSISPTEAAAAVAVTAEISAGAAEASVQANAKIAPPPKEPKPIITPQSKRPKAPTGAVVAARKNVKVTPIVHANVQQTATTQTTEAATTTANTKAVQNSMQSNQVALEAVMPIPDIDNTKTNPNQCSFNIPYPSGPTSFDQCPTHIFVGRDISPDLFISILDNWTNSRLTWSFLNRIRNRISSPNEFDQKCILPALHAHTLGGEACRSREITVYLQWLMYLRSQLDEM